MSPRSKALLLLGAVLSMLLGGCANYRLGTEGKLSFTRLYIAPVDNKTLLPQARALLGTQLREAFAKDGRIALVNSAGDAEATLHVVIRDYHREVASVLESDSGLARKFTLTLGATYTLHDLRTQKDLFTDRVANAQRDAFTDGGQLQSEYQALPLLADLLAQKVSHAVLDVW